MKNVFVTINAILLFILLSTETSAQLELKANPLGYLWGRMSGQVELNLSKNLGAEVSVFYDMDSYFVLAVEDEKAAGLGGGLFMKYFMKPSDKGCDNFYISIYGRLSETESQAANSPKYFAVKKVSAGAMVGYKIVSSHKIVFEVALGGGKNFVNDFTGVDEIVESILEPINIDFVGRFSFGYRF